MLGAGHRPLAVNRLRTRHDDLFDGQVVLADHLQQLRGAETVYVDVLGNFGHVAAVRALVEDHVDVRHRRADRRPVGQVAPHELGLRIDPGGFAVPVGLGFEVVQDPDGPAFADEEVGDVGTDQAGPAGDEGAFCVGGHAWNIRRGKEVWSRHERKCCYRTGTTPLIFPGGNRGAMRANDQAQRRRGRKQTFL